jgi:hypothetical protein
MHARVLASVRRRCNGREHNGQEAANNIISELAMGLVRDGLMVPRGFKHSTRPLRHAALVRSYGAPKRR